MAITIKTNFNNITYGDEARKIRELQEQFSAGAHVSFTTTGNENYTSLSSGEVYDTSTSSDPNILNKGMQGLLYWLTSLFLLSTGDGGYGNCLIDADYLTSIITAIRQSELIYGDDAGSTDTYAISLQIAPSAYSDGMMINFRANTQNTGACTLNVNGLGAVNIKDVNGADPTTGMIIAGQIVSVIYDGTNFVIKSVCPLMNTTGSTLTSPIINTPTITSPLLQGDITGWNYANETWTYASASTFTIAGVNVTAKYKKGTRLRWKQGGAYKYGVVLSSTFSTNTTVTILVNTDYTIATPTAITDNYYSYQDAQGYPCWFNCAAPAFTGIDNGTTGVQPTTSEYRMCITACNTCKVHFRITGAVKNGLSTSYSWVSTVATNNLTPRSTIGLSYFQVGAVDYVGVVIILSSTGFYAVANAPLADNTVFDNLSCTLDYEI